MRRQVGRIPTHHDIFCQLDPDPLPARRNKEVRHREESRQFFGRRDGIDQRVVLDTRRRHRISLDIGVGGIIHVQAVESQHGITTAAHPYLAVRHLTVRRVQHGKHLVALELLRRLRASIAIHRITRHSKGTNIGKGTVEIGNEGPIRRSEQSGKGTDGIALDVGNCAVRITDRIFRITVGAKKSASMGRGPVNLPLGNNRTPAIDIFENVRKAVTYKAANFQRLGRGCVIGDTPRHVAVVKGLRQYWLIGRIAFQFTQQASHIDFARSLDTDIAAIREPFNAGQVEESGRIAGNTADLEHRVVAKAFHLDIDRALVHRIAVLALAFAKDSAHKEFFIVALRLGKEFNFTLVHEVADFAIFVLAEMLGTGNATDIDIHLTRFGEVFARIRNVGKDLPVVLQVRNIPQHKAHDTAHVDNAV